MEMGKYLLTGASGSLGRTILEVWRQNEMEKELRGVSRSDVDLCDYSATLEMLGDYAPRGVIHTAAFVRGVDTQDERTSRALTTNLRIDSNVLEACKEVGVPDMIYFGSATMYSNSIEKPFREADGLRKGYSSYAGGYGLAKAVGVEVCRLFGDTLGLGFHALVLPNVYGVWDRRGKGAHLVSAAIAKVAKAKRDSEETVEILGNPKDSIELVFAQDVAQWLYDRRHDWKDLPSVLNIAAGPSLTVEEVYSSVAEVLGYKGTFRCQRPNGASARVVSLDATLASKFGWNAKTRLREGIIACCKEWGMIDSRYLEQQSEVGEP